MMNHNDAVITKYVAGLLLISMAGLVSTPEGGYLSHDNGVGMLVANVEEVCQLVHDERERMEDIREGLEGDRDIFHRTFCDNPENNPNMYKFDGHIIICRMLQIHIDLIDGKGRPGDERGT